MKVDVFDMGDPILAAHREKMVNGFTDGIIHMQPVSNGVMQMVDNVVNYVAASGNLNRLRIWGHGWAGGQLVSDGADANAGKADNNALWGGNVYDNAYYLANLTPLFASDGMIELHGCSVGQGLDGEKFLVRLAQSVNVPVAAGSVVQGGAGSSLVVGQSVAWDGQVTVAYPDLTVVYVQGGTL